MIALRRAASNAKVHESSSVLVPAMAEGLHEPHKRHPSHSSALPSACASARSRPTIDNNDIRHHQVTVICYVNRARYELAIICIVVVVCCFFAKNSRERESAALARASLHQTPCRKQKCKSVNPCSNLCFKGGGGGGKALGNANLLNLPHLCGSTHTRKFHVLHVQSFGKSRPSSKTHFKTFLSATVSLEQKRCDEEFLALSRVEVAELPSSERPLLPVNDSGSNASSFAPCSRRSPKGCGAGSGVGSWL